MAEFKLVEGTLFVGTTAADAEQVTDDVTDRYSYAVFKAGSFAVTFHSGHWGSYPVTDAHIQETDEGPVYYPYHNETVAEVQVGERDATLDMAVDTVSLRYATVDGDLYICSQNEITAYGGTYLVRDDDLYKVHDSLFSRPDGVVSERDPFLDIAPVEEPVRVQHVETGYSKPVPYDQVATLVENDEPNGALKLREPDNILDTVTDTL